MKIKDIFDKEEFEQYISAAINLRNEQKGRLNEMLEIKYIDSDMEKQEVNFEFPVYEWELNPFDILHGGISAAMLDYAMGLAANCICRKLGGFFSPTVNMTVNYLAAFPKESKADITVRMISEGKSLLTFWGELRSKETGALSVTASATYKVLRK